MTDFATLDEIKQFCGLDIKEVEPNSIIAMLNTWATQKIQSFLDKDIFKTTYDEYYDIGAYQATLVLDQYPIISIESVLDNETTLVVTTNYKAYKADGRLIRINDYWYEGYQTVRVQYTAGYETPPYVCKVAALKMIYNILNNPGGLTNLTSSGTSWNKAWDRMGLEKTVANEIGYLRRMNPRRGTAA